VRPRRAPLRARRRPPAWDPQGLSTAARGDGAGKAPGEGVRTRRSRHPYPANEVTTWKGIPVTSPARTLVDLAAVLSEDDLALAFHHAIIRHHTTPTQV
jgi:hypothetical protein